MSAEDTGGRHTVGPRERALPLECPACGSWRKRFQGGWAECGRCGRPFPSLTSAIDAEGAP